MLNKAIFIHFFTLFLALFSMTAHSTVKLPNAFSNSMVIQRNVPARIWGTAANDENVTVQFNNQSKNVVAKNGTWTITLEPMEAGGPYTMTIKGQNTVTVSDVYVGEVWQCAGQSNMDTRVSYYPHYKEIMNSTKLPMLRFLTIRQPGGANNNVWETCTSADKIGKLSCLGFFFGKEIVQALKGNIAVGLIVTAVGGTTIASWLDPITVAADPDIKKIDSTAASMYEAWVKPVVGYAFCGTLWMQGEQDRSNGLQKHYHQRLLQLIDGWRKIWEIGDFPFYIAQIANYGTVQTDPNESATSAVIREAQRLGLAVKNTTLTVLIDLGDSLHFSNKQEAGRRLALIARAIEYGESSLVYSGPLFIRKVVEGSKVHCLFNHCGSGMKPKSGGKLTGFAIAGSNNSYTWADAIIHGDTITVSSSSVSKPVNVRYAYGANPVGNLINVEGLPASPFTTDDPQLPYDTSKTAVFTGLKSVSRDKIKIKNDKLWIMNGAPAGCSIAIFTLNGKKMYNFQYSSDKIDKFINIPIDHMKSGSYIVRLSGETETLNGKIRIVH